MNYFKYIVIKNENEVQFEVYDEFGDRDGTDSWNGKNSNENINEILSFGYDKAIDLLYEFFDEKVINYKGFQIILQEMESGPN